MRLALTLLASLLATTALAGDKDKVPLGELADRAVQQSKLILPGGKAFHLKASIVETTNPASSYHAEVDEYWVSPTKWKRTIESPHFSQTLVVNGDAVSEKDTGDYFPFWLNELLTAIFDPLPMLDVLKKTNTELEKPHGSKKSTVCADLHFRVDRWVICFAGDHGELESVITKGYAPEFKDYQTFGEKRVARQIVTEPERGTTIEAKVTELAELTHPDDQIFAIQESTAPAERIKSVKIDEDAFRKLVLGSTEIDWPPMGGGPATGGCAVYASADRAGHVREVWPEGCDSTGLEEPLRDQIKKWQLKPAASGGAPVQVEALLSFVFNTTVDNSHPLPQLSNAEVRKLATHKVEPVFPPGSAQSGAEFAIDISVDETGKLTGAGNPNGLENPIFSAAYGAVTKWHFVPYIKDGKPQYFHATLIFHMQ